MSDPPSASWQRDTTSWYSSRARRDRSSAVVTADRTDGGRESDPWPSRIDEQSLPTSDGSEFGSDRRGDRSDTASCHGASAVSAIVIVPSLLDTGQGLWF